MFKRVESYQDICAASVEPLPEGEEGRRIGAWLFACAGNCRECLIVYPHLAKNLLFDSESSGTTLAGEDALLHIARVVRAQKAKDGYNRHRFQLVRIGLEDAMMLQWQLPKPGNQLLRIQVTGGKISRITAKTPASTSMAAISLTGCYPPDT